MNDELDEVSTPIYWNEETCSKMITPETSCGLRKGHDGDCMSTEPTILADPNYIDPKDFNRNSQIAHFFTLAFLNLLWAFPLHAFSHSNWAFAGMLPSLAYGVWHEFVHDPGKENLATRGSDWEDFGFLMAGTITGQIVAAVFVILSWVALG